LQLALIDFEIKHLPGLNVLASQMPFYLTLEVFSRQFLRFVQPGYTVEVLTVPASDLGWLGGLCPT
jgi:hypothetical protein